MAIPTQNIYTGIGLMLLATVFWSCLDTSAKVLITYGDLPAATVIWMRLFGGLVSSYFIGCLIDRRWDIWRVSRPWGQFWRSFFMAATTICNFTAVQHLPLTTTIALFFTSPLFIAALSQPLLGEKVGRMRWSAIVIGFVGVLVVVQPWGDGFSPWVILSLGAGFFFGMLQIVTRKIASHDSAGSAVFYTTTVGAVAMLPVMLLIPGNFALPSEGWVWALFLVAGLIFGTGGHMFNVLALHFAGPVRVAPFFYLSFLWMTIFQLVLFDGAISPWTFVGAFIIISSGLFVFWRETRAKQL